MYLHINEIFGPDIIDIRAYDCRGLAFMFEQIKYVNLKNNQWRVNYDGSVVIRIAKLNFYQVLVIRYYDKKNSTNNSMNYGLKEIKIPIIKILIAQQENQA
jgi:hypothetical protein